MRNRLQKLRKSKIFNVSLSIKIISFLRVPVIKKETIAESVFPPPSLPSDTIVKRIHFVNEKKDVGLQLSRSDLPTSNSDKSIQTRWTSTKTRIPRDHQSISHYVRTIEDPSFDDPTITFYQPPALYFNSDSDFLQMKSPPVTKIITQAKESRLSYLASIPIASFDGETIVDNSVENKSQQPPKQKSTSNVRFNLPSKPKSHTLAKDFLHHFPLLRALVEEALALQQQTDQCDIPISIEHILANRRPQSAVGQGQKLVKTTVVRPKSAPKLRSMSVIIPRNINNFRRSNPPPSKTNQTKITKSDVRNLVDRLTKSKVKKKVEQTIPSTDQTVPMQEPTGHSSLHRPTKPSVISVCLCTFIVYRGSFFFSL